MKERIKALCKLLTLVVAVPIVSAAQIPTLTASLPLLMGSNWGVNLTNNFSAPVTAYALRIAGPNGSRLKWQDSVLSEADLHLELNPGVTRAVRLGHGTPASGAVVVAAVIYADGSTAGEAALVAHFIKARQYFLAELPKAIRSLQAALNDPGTDRSLLMQQFETGRDAGSAALADRALATSDGVSGAVIATLKNHPSQNLQATLAALVKQFTAWQVKLQGSLPQLQTPVAP